MRKSRTPGSVRGVSGNGYPYRDKNSYGAYAGKQLFATFLGKNADGKLIAASFDVNSQTGEPIDQTVISTLCASAGYDIPVKKMFFKDVNKNRAEKNIPKLSSQYMRP